MSLYRRGLVWWLDVYVGEGRKRVRKSTGTSDKIRAKIIEQSVIAVNRNITSRQRAMTIIDNVLPQRERSLALCEAPAYYQACLQDEKATIAKYGLRHRVSILSKFAMWAHDNSRINYVEEVDAALAFAFVKSLGTELTAKTKNSYIGELGTAWKLFMRHDKTETNPWPIVKVPRNRNEETSGRAFTQDEINRLMIAAGQVGHDWQTTIMIGLYTGLRYGDAASLKWSDIDFESRVLHYTPSKTRKHDIKVHIPLHPALAKWLQGHKNNSDHITPWRLKVQCKWKRPSDGNVSFCYLLDMAKIKKISPHERLSFHCFRHTFVSLLAQAGVSSDIRMKLVGHTSNENHAIYTHDDISTRTAINTLPVIPYTL